MLKKSICDCPAPVRALLKDNGIVDYDKLKPGEKVNIEARMGGKDVVVSCYRAKGRGDKRIWFNKAKQLFANTSHITLKVYKGKLMIQGWSTAGKKDGFRGMIHDGQVIFSLPRKEGK